MRRVRFSLLCTVSVLVLAACSGPIRTSTGGGGGGGGITVSLNRSSATVNVFGTQQFSATVNGSSNQAVTWQVNGVTGGSKATGFVSSTGLYVAPSGVPVKSDGSGGVLLATVTVSAVSVANTGASGSAVVTVEALTNQNAQTGAVKLGTSGGNSTDFAGGMCCGGTLGSLLTRGGTKYILSNNHVLAKSDFGTAGGPPNGDPITQPGIIDVTQRCSTTGTTKVANLSEFYNLQTGSLPKVDAAMAQIVNGAVDPTGSILLLGSTMTNGVPDPAPPTAGGGISPTTAQGSPHNGLVAKVGRTTGLTCASILTIGFTTTITYTQNCDGTGTSFPVTYNDMVQVTGGQFGAPGDSGSLIVTQDTAEGVAILVGGNDQDTVGNAITDVLTFFTNNGGSTTTIVGGATTHSVLGCSLPTAPANAVQTLSASALAGDTLQKATAIRDAHGPQLMGHPEVQAVGVGASYDNPAEAAIVFFVIKGQPRSNLPQQVDGVRTRIVENDSFAARGLVSATEGAMLEKSAAAPQLVYPISEAEMARAKVVQTAHMAEILKQPGVQGVGISSSADSAGEAALLIYFIRGVEHWEVPQVIDGLRTRVREGSRFRGDYGGVRPKRGCSVPAPKTTQAGTASVAKPKP
jgi:hypothetical protein